MLKPEQFRSPYIARPNNTSMQSTTKPWLPVPSGTQRVHDQGAGSGQLGPRAGDAKNLWVKKIRRRKRVGRLKVATYNDITILRDEHIQELEEELRETRFGMGYNRDLLCEKTRGMFHYRTKRPPTIPF